MNIQNIKERIASLNTFLEEREEEILGKKMSFQAHQIALERATEKLDEFNLKIELNDKSITVLSNLVNSRTDNVVQAIKNTIDDALKSIPITNDYTIDITEGETKRSGKELHIKLYDREADKTRGLRTASGTAVAQLVSFILRVVLVGFSSNRKILVVDENFSGFQDTETINMFGTVLATLAENEGFQIIMVEHKSEFLNVPNIKNVILKKESYLEGVVVDSIIDAKDYEEF